MSQKVMSVQGMPQILLTFGLTICSLSILLPASPAWASYGGASYLGAGAANSVLMAVTVLTQFSVPALTRRFSWRLVLPAGVLLMGLPSLIQALSPALPNILATSALRGVGFGIVTVCCSSALAYLVPSKQRGRAVGLYGLAAAASQLIFTPLVPWALDHLGYQLVIASGAVAALAAPFAYRLGSLVDAYLAANPQILEPKQAAGGLSWPVLLGRIWPSLLTLTLVTSAGGALLTFSTDLAPTPLAASTALLLMCALAVPTRLYGGSLTDRWGTRLLMVPSLAVTGLGLLLLAWSLASSQLLLLLLGSAILGFGYGFLQSVTMVRALNEAGGPEASQKASVAWNAHFDIGTGLGALALGALAQVWSFAFAWLLLAALTLVSALVMGFKDLAAHRAES